MIRLGALYCVATSMRAPSEKIRHFTSRMEKKKKTVRYASALKKNSYSPTVFIYDRGSEFYALKNNEKCSYTYAPTHIQTCYIIKNALRFEKKIGYFFFYLFQFFLCII